MKKEVRKQLKLYKSFILHDLKLTRSSRNLGNNLWMKARGITERMFLSWLDKDERSMILLLMMYCARSLIIDDSDYGSINEVITKLSVIYNSQSRVHTTISRAEQEMIVCQSSLPTDLRSYHKTNFN